MPKKRGGGGLDSLQIYGGLDKKEGSWGIFEGGYRAGNIMHWFCRAIKQCNISVKIYTAIMVKVTFEIKSNTQFE